MAKSYDLKPNYFRTSQTRKIFPKFSFSKNNVPLGNSINMCIAVHWGDLDRGKHFDIMKTVQGFPKCGSTLSGKFIWNEDDTEYGFDIPPWTQEMHEADCSDEDCPDYCENNYDGVFVDGINRHVCYSYEILDKICIIIRYDNVKNDYYFHGGCFANNQTYQMRKAHVGEVEDFYSVEIEIRDYNDPIIQAGEWTNYSYDFGNGWRYVAYLLNICLLVAIGLLCYVAYDIYLLKKKFKGIPGLPLVKEEEMKNGGNQGFAL